jgi:RNA polymerase sigma-70 factor (ECF subfamily)
MVRDYQEAENLTQDTFLSAYTHLEHCDPDNLKPWLARIATNKAKDYLKSAYIRRVRLDDDTETTKAVPLDPSPDDIYIAKEKRQFIGDKIRSLKEPICGFRFCIFCSKRRSTRYRRYSGGPKKPYRPSFTALR